MFEDSLSITLYIFKLFPGHALPEKGLQTLKRRRSTGQQPGTQSASRPAFKPLINRGSTTGQPLISFLRRFKIRIRLFVLPKRRSGQCSRFAGGQEGGLFPGWIDPTATRPTLPRPASLPRRAPPRPDRPVVCPGFGFDKSFISFLHSII